MKKITSSDVGYRAWWGSVIYWGLMTLSAILSFSRARYLDLLAQMKSQGRPSKGATLFVLDISLAMG